MSKVFSFVIFFIILLANINPMAIAQSSVLLETSEGNIKIRLYDETPLHRDNFLKLVREGFYDSLLFHRCILNFMIQTGDPESKNASADQPLGSGGPSYKLPAEIVAGYYHKKGAVAAARQGDSVNPEKKSSGSQFYIVQGSRLSNSQLDALENSKQHVPFTQEQRQTYTSLGGTPHLDNSYTVFGEVTEGQEVIDIIASSPTGPRNRPVKDIRIIHATVIH